jgi:hypothetical protein
VWESKSGNYLENAEFSGLVPARATPHPGQTEAQGIAVMPVQYWRHACREGRPVISFSASPCACGTPKVYDGWHNTSLEVMAWNQKFTGLKSMGPHLDLQERLFENTTKPCPDCGGRGYHDIAAGAGFDVCTMCDGAGLLSTISPEQRAALRAEVLSTFPDASAPSDLPNPAFSTVIHDLHHRVMLVLPMARNS